MLRITAVGPHPRLLGLATARYEYRSGRVVRADHPRLQEPRVHQPIERKGQFSALPHPIALRAPRDVDARPLEMPVLLTIVRRVVVETAHGDEGHQFRLGIATFDRLDRLLGRDDAGLFARTGVFQLHVLIDIELRRNHAHPLGQHLADLLPGLAAARTRLLVLGNVQHDVVAAAIPPEIAAGRGLFLCASALTQP